MPHSPAASKAVPTFLYGETRRSAGPRFLHLEALEERSRPRDWTIRAHAHADLHHVFLIAAGSGAMQADGAARFAAPCLLFVPARTVHAFTWQRETSGEVLTLADAYLRRLLGDGGELGVLFERACCVALGDAAAFAGRRRWTRTCCCWSMRCASARRRI